MRSKIFFTLDTNILVSGLLFEHSNPAKAIDKAIDTGVVIFSRDTLEEFKTTFLGRKVGKYSSQQKRLDTIYTFIGLCTLVHPNININDCRDPKDNKFLELAVAAKASCIITGDDDLLILHPFRGIPIVNANDFLNMTF